MSLQENLFLTIRKLVLLFLKVTSHNILIRHHFTGRSFQLNTYFHKGYWFYGKKREKDSMKRFKEIIKPGMKILEIGGHIGYLTTFFSFLVGKNGSVTVFEPGKNNLPYLKKNVRYSEHKNITIEEFAAGKENCSMTFYLDPITGQNNSLVKDFEGFCSNRTVSAQPTTGYVTDSVEVVCLDDYLKNKELPDFIKIDIEGYEWECLEGLNKSILKKRPILMIEIQANSDKIIRYFESINYQIMNDRLDVIRSLDNYEKLGTANMFFLPKE